MARSNKKKKSKGANGNDAGGANLPPSSDLSTDSVPTQVRTGDVKVHSHREFFACPQSLLKIRPAHFTLKLQRLGVSESNPKVLAILSSREGRGTCRGLGPGVCDSNLSPITDRCHLKAYIRSWHIQ
eukprot:1191722-Prorocentrum_minimum.AAC.1